MPATTCLSTLSTLSTVISHASPWNREFLTSDARKSIKCPTAGSEPASGSSENPPVMICPVEKAEPANMITERMTMRREVLMVSLDFGTPVSPVESPC